MIATVKDEITPTMQEIARQAPDICAGALKDVGAHLRRQMAKDLKTGAAAGETLRPLDSVTLALRRAMKGGLLAQRRKLRAAGFNKKSKAMQKVAGQLRRYSNDDRLGGKLPELIEYVAGELSVYVGWMGRYFRGVEKAAMRFQASAGPLKFTQQQLRQFAVILGRQFKEMQLWNMPYIRPDRPVMRKWERALTVGQSESTEIFRKSFMARLDRLKVKNA